MIYNHRKRKKPTETQQALRYLADSNRRPRFCRPIPNHSGKVPFAAAKIHLFYQLQGFFVENF